MCATIASVAIAIAISVSIIAIAMTSLYPHFTCLERLYGYHTHPQPQKENAAGSRGAAEPATPVV